MCSCSPYSVIVVLSGLLLPFLCLDLFFFLRYRQFVGYSYVTAGKYVSVNVYTCTCVNVYTYVCVNVSALLVSLIVFLLLLSLFLFLNHIVLFPHHHLDRVTGFQINVSKYICIFLPLFLSIWLSLFHSRSLSLNPIFLLPQSNLPPPSIQSASSLHLIFLLPFHHLDIVT